VSRLGPRTLLALPLALALGACGGGGGGGSSTTTPATPPPTTSTSFDVQPCLDQVAAPGQTVANLVIPDTLKLDLTKPNGFPNGRQLTDPAIDITLAFLFLDLTKTSKMALANLPLNPAGNDKPFRPDFPYLAPPQGNPPGLTPGGVNFVFRNSPVSSYVQVDRMGMPAVATVLISTAMKSAYNDDSPAVDGTRKYVSLIAGDLTDFTNELEHDVAKTGLPLCAKGL
jgi:hypothetical protein